MRINFENKPVHGDDDKYTRKKIKIYAGSIITNFHNQKMPREKAPCKCLSVMMIDLKVYSSNTFRRMKISTRKDKN